MLKDNDVVEHIFLFGVDWGRKRYTWDTLLYHTRARMCAMEKMLYGENGAYMYYKENEKKKKRKKEITEITIEQR